MFLWQQILLGFHRDRITYRRLETPALTNRQETLADWEVPPTEEQSVCIIYCDDKFAYSFSCFVSQVLLIAFATALLPLLLACTEKTRSQIPLRNVSVYVMTTRNWAQ